jgi:hypothetical protein
MKKLEALQLMVDAKRRSMGAKYDDSLYRIHRLHRHIKGGSGSSSVVGERIRPATAAASALKYSNERPTTASSMQNAQRVPDIRDNEGLPNQYKL